MDSKSAKITEPDDYDFPAVESDHLAIVVGDPSGKDVPAASIMAMANSLLGFRRVTSSPLQTS